MSDKYTLEIAKAELGADGFATSEGWITVYNCDSQTREYVGATKEFLMIGVGLPANSYIDVPTIPDSEDKAVVRGEQGWVTIPDYRDKIAYDTTSGMAVRIASLGELPENLTFVEPKSQFDKWIGGKWVIDADSQHAFLANQREEEQRQLTVEASAAIAPLQDAVDTDIATDEEKTRLLEWKKYRALVGRVNASDLDDEFPTKPE